MYYFSGKTRPGTVVFESYMGRAYACSPKALYQAMLNDRRYRSYEFIWAFKNCEKYEFLKKNPNTRVVEYLSHDYFKAYSKAEYWISNSRVPEQIRKRNDQVYIQSWHGTPLKRLGFDVELDGGNAMNSIKELCNKYAMDARRYTYMISPSAFCTEKFLSAFNLKNLNKRDIILETGYPRNDALFCFGNEDASRVKNTLGLPSDKKVILYAPTWRDDQHETDMGYTYEPDVDFELLRRELGAQYVILYRAHYFIANRFDFAAYSGFVFDASDYDDINELYIISDILVTDYSSVFFDYANLKRPIIFYMYDFEFYKNRLRDFYIETDTLPGDIVKTEKELIDAIHRAGENFKYDEKYKAFNLKYNYLDGPDTSRKVLDEIALREANRFL